MEEYKNNSKKSKSEETKTIEKVISGTAKTKKKNDVKKLTDVFIPDLMGVLVPVIKKAISDIVINGIDIFLYGEAGHTKKPSGTKPSYRSYYERDRKSVV